MKDFRCGKCHKLLGKYLGVIQLEIKCPRCGVSNYLKGKIISSDIRDQVVSVSN